MIRKFFKRTAGKKLFAPVLLVAAFAAQCAPPTAPTSYNGVGHCGTRKTSTISGSAYCSSVADNGFTKFRSLCDYYMYVPGGQSFNITTAGTWKNPPNATSATVNYPETTREISPCAVPSVLYLPAGSSPSLTRVSFQLG